MTSVQHPIGYKLKKQAPEPVNLMVDPDPGTWNTFLDFVFDWAPKLKQIYDDKPELDQV